MSCPDRESLSAFADGAAEAASRAEIECHLAGCASCREFVAGMRQVNDRGRASLQAIRVDTRAEPMAIARKSSRTRLFRALIPAAAAVLLASVTALFIAQRINGGRTRPATASKQRPPEEKFVMPSDADFEAWAAPYRRMHVPLVPLEDVPTYRPPEIRPMLPESGTSRNHS
jgi:anti-sigma factor RsiW